MSFHEEENNFSPLFPSLLNSNTAKEESHFTRATLALGALISRL
jgi:hypothetical protein